MALKNPIMFYLIFFFVVINIVDSITAFFILPGEANPVYLLTGSIIPVIAIKVLVIYLVIHYYRRNIYPSHFIYYLIILLLVLGTLLISIGVYTNIIGMMHTEEIIQAAAIPTVEKVKLYVVSVSIFYFLPVIFSLLAFHLYYKSLSSTKIDSKHYKKFKWWQY